MPAALPGTIALLAGLAWLAGVVWFLRHFRAPAVAAEGRVSLLLAVTGRTAGLPLLFAALARQTLRPRRLIAAVESEADPAFAQLRELAPSLPFPVEIVVAGIDDSRSQKATNLIAGLRLVDAQDDALVLLDADILPQDQWLSWLATPALNGTAEVVTGYRWHALDGAGPGRHLVGWLDRTLALGPRFVAARHLWGGSIALSRAAVARMNIPGALDRCFSDDGAIGRRARALHLRVLTRRAVLVPTPREGGDWNALAFMRRQLQIVRLNATGLWWLMGGVLAMEAASLLLLAMALAGDAAALGWLAPLCAIGLLRALLQDRVTRAVGIREGGLARAGQWLAGAAVPLTAPLLLLLFASSARTRIIRWRHLTYEVRGPDDVRVLRRTAHGGAA